MPIPLGIFATAGASVAGGDFELIQTIYGTGSSGSLEFSSIPQSYKHLEIRTVNRISSGGDSINVNGMRLNGSAGSYDYRVQQMMADSNDFIYSNPYDSSYIPWYSTNTTNNHGVAMIQIPDYTATKHKGVMIDFANGNQQRTGKTAVVMTVSTGAITSIQIFSASGGSFSSTSRFSLYGLKG